MAKILIPLYGEEVAPRFDQATEAWVGWVEDRGRVKKERILLLAQSSAEEMCQLVISENIEAVICNAIEDQYFDYLQWKKVRVIDSVIATMQQALTAFARDELVPGSILFRE